MVSQVVTPEDASRHALSITITCRCIAALAAIDFDRELATLAACAADKPEMFAEIPDEMAHVKRTLELARELVAKWSESAEATARKTAHKVKTCP